MRPELRTYAPVDAAGGARERREREPRAVVTPNHPAVRGGIRTAVLFNGQASHFPGFGRDIYEVYTSARSTYDAVEEYFAKTHGESFKRLCFNDELFDIAKQEVTERDVLKKTEYQQLPILTYNQACLWAIHEEQQSGQGIVSPGMAGGYSLGLYSGIIASGAIDFMDAVQLIDARSKAMEDAIKSNPGGEVLVTMRTRNGEITGDHRAFFARAFLENRRHRNRLHIAAINSDIQIAVAAREGDLARFTHFLERYKRRYGQDSEFIRDLFWRRLDVAGPFHSPLVKDAVVDVQAAMEDIHLRNAAIPVIANTSGELIRGIGELMHEIAESVPNSILFNKAIQTMLSHGIKYVVQPGQRTHTIGMMPRLDGYTTAEIRGERSGATLGHVWLPKDELDLAA